jgi:hypothetical protein
MTSPVALTRPAYGPETGDDGVVQPDQPFTTFVDLVLITRAAERERSGYSLEAGLADRNADHDGDVSLFRRLLLSRHPRRHQ